MNPLRASTFAVCALFAVACESERASETAAPAPTAAAEPEAKAPPPAEAPATDAIIDTALAGAHRSEENRARDRYRHPKETLLFFGIEPGMAVVELWPGGGWYTEVLAPILREDGNLVVAPFPIETDSEYRARVARRYAEKLAATPEVYGNVVAIDFEPPAHARLGEPGSADLVLTFRNLHNWLAAGTMRDVFVAAHDVLRPGGTFGVVEHRGKPGMTKEAMATTGYVSEEHVIEVARDVGFELDTRSEVNANPADSTDHPEGVWTLPPSLRLCRDLEAGSAEHTACREKYEAIGESDRMTLRFVKPPAG